MKQIKHYFYVGDVIEVLKSLPDESVHCVVTSPPYWGLRDYGVEGQIGQEKTIEEYIEKLVNVFREVRRVLRKDGTLWLNLGDMYCGTGHKGKYRDPKYKEGRNGQVIALNNKIKGLKPKDLVGMPWMVAFALRSDGWYLRTDIIWHKTNAMPESVKDRPSRSHEYIFLFTKSKKYFYDIDAIREPHKTDAVNKLRDKSKENYNLSYPGGHFSPGARPEGHILGRNKRTVWSIPTYPFPEAHFATFPPDLVEPCIKAGTSEYGCCPKCGAPYKRIIAKGEQIKEWMKVCGADSQLQYKGQAKKDYEKAKAQNTSDVKRRILESLRERITVGWEATCSCGVKEVVPCVVLDPFGGSGTTTVVANRLRRSSIYIDLSPEYAEMAKRRLEKDSNKYNLDQYKIISIPA